MSFTRLLLPLVLALVVGREAQGGVGCTTDEECNDGLFCNGTEFCVAGECLALSACPPFVNGCIVGSQCDEASDSCLPIGDDTLCDDGAFCNGVEQCDATTGDCVAVSACPPFINGCIVSTGCDEESDTCLSGPDDSLCPPGQICLPDGTCVTPTTTTTTLPTTTTTIGTTTTTTTTTLVTTTTLGSTSTTTIVVTTTSSSTSSTASSATSSTATSTTNTTVTSSTSTTVPADDHPVSGAKLLMKDSTAKPEKRRLRILSRDGDQLALDDVPNLEALLLQGGSLHVRAVGGDGFDATYPLAADGWALLKAKKPSKGMKFADANGPINKITLSAGKQLRVAGKGAGLDQTLGGEPDVIEIVLSVGTRRYCVVFGGSERSFTAGKSLSRKNAPSPAACP